MNVFARCAIRDLLLLSLTAGSADAAGFMGLGHVFTSNMTGNVVLFGMDLGQGHLWEATRSVYVLMVFMCGVCWGAWMCHQFTEADWPRLMVRVVGCEAFLLGLFAILWCLIPDGERSHSAYPLVTLLALAMGIQAAFMYRLNVPGVATTAVTGTLTSLVSTLVKAINTPIGAVTQDDSANKKMAFQALVLSLYCGGAIVSGILMLWLPRMVGFFPAILVAAVLFGRRGTTA